MQAAWRLAISSLSGRRLRTALLVGAVALASALIVGVACAVSSLNAGMADRLAASIGAADVVVRHVGGKPVGRGALETARAWPEVEVLVPQRYGGLSLRNPVNDARILAFGAGLDPEAEARLRKSLIHRGRPVGAPGEIVVQPKIADALDVRVGDVIEIERPGAPIRVEVVGVTPPPIFASMLQRPLAQVVAATLAEATGDADRVDQIAIVLREGADLDAFVNARAAELPEGVILEPSARITSGLDDSMRSSNIGMTIVSVFAFLGASFIILAGLSTSVAERQRELAIIRCIGGAPRQIGVAQLIVGLLLGAQGALVGAPLGIALAWAGTIVYSEHFPSGLAVSWLGLGLAAAGSIGAGLVGSVWPAWRAARSSPLQALAVRAQPVRRSALVLLTLAGAVLAGAQIAIMLSIDDGQAKYWSYVSLGAPMFFIGYFLMSAGVTSALARLLAPPVAFITRVPRALLAESIAGAPWRHGFTAGSLMAGLAIMTALWTQGSSLLRDWVGAIRFPDAFVQGLSGLTEDDRRAVAALPFVEETVAIGMQRIDEAAFGVHALRKVGTMFVGFEPRPFFRIASLEWVEGEQDEAVRRLEQGGAVLVSREFRTAHGLGLGDAFTLTHNGETISFEIAGVISSPGLDIASKYFDVSAEYREQSLHAVIGTRTDLIRYFGNDAIRLIQLDLADNVTDEDAMAAIRRALRGRLVVAGSGREIMAGINSLGLRAMRAMSTVAVAAMLIACFGVGNIVVAGVDARRFEFGVLRAVGAQGSLLARLVVAETLIVAFAACVLGVALGVQSAFNGVQLYRALGGIELTLRPPALPILAGCAILTALTLAAAAPTAIALARRKPRELLAATRG